MVIAVTATFKYVVQNKVTGFYELSRLVTMIQVLFSQYRWVQILILTIRRYARGQRFYPDIWSQDRDG